MSAPSQKQTRREFFKAAARTTLLGSLGLLSAVLFRRQQECRNQQDGCSSCQLSANCELPWKEVKR